MLQLVRRLDLAKQTSWVKGVEQNARSRELSQVEGGNEIVIACGARVIFWRKASIGADSVNGILSGTKLVLLIFSWLQPPLTPTFGTFSFYHFSCPFEAIFPFYFFFCSRCF